MTALNLDGPSGRKSGKSIKVLLGIGGLAAVVFLSSTLAANININSGPVEFGQGVAQTTTCDDNIFITPQSTFVNREVNADFLFNAFSVTDISTACQGKTFTIKAYKNGQSSALELYDSNGTIYSEISVRYIDGSFSFVGGGLLSDDIENITGGFNVTIGAGIQPAFSLVSGRDLDRITIESKDSIEVTPATYAIGDVGPGGGKIFYYSEAGFNCGPTFSATGSPTGGKCHYLEAAPRTWSGGTDDPGISWATDVNSNRETSVTGATETAIGSGYKNSLAIEAQSGNVAATSAAVAARAYSGGSKTDWYLPSIDELIELNGNKVAADALNGYWSSSEGAADGAYDLGYNGGPPGLARPGKQQTTPVRPVRAF